MWPPISKSIRIDLQEALAFSFAHRVLEGRWESMMARVLHLSNLCIAALFIQQVVEHNGTTSQLPDEEGRERV